MFCLLYPIYVNVGSLLLQCIKINSTFVLSAAASYGYDSHKPDYAHWVWLFKMSELSLQTLLPFWVFGNIYSRPNGDIRIENLC